MQYHRLIVQPEKPPDHQPSIAKTAAVNSHNKPILEYARMAKLVDDERDARVSRKAGAESDRKDQHSVLAIFRQHQ